MTGDGDDLSQVAARLKQHRHRRAAYIVEVQILNPRFLARLFPLKGEVALLERLPGLCREKEC